MRILNINIQFYTLGYLDTNLSFGKDLTLPRGSIIKLSNLVYGSKIKTLKKYITRFIVNNLFNNKSDPNFYS